MKHVAQRVKINGFVCVINRQQSRGMLLCRYCTVDIVPPVEPLKPGTIGIAETTQIARFDIKKKIFEGLNPQPSA